MIISRTPFRISFFGGGTDYPVWYEKNQGAVIAATIDKYCYITVRYLPPFFDYNYRIRYTYREETQKISQIKHPSVRECLKFLNFKRGVEIQHNSDLPARIGIGSSSAFTVGLLNALYALQGKMASKKQLALEAIHVEQDLIKEHVGSQDQTSAAFGGLNRIDFGSEHKIQIKPLPLHFDKLNNLQDHLMLFFTGFSRTASEIASEQIKQMPDKEEEMLKIYDMVDQATKILNNNKKDITDFGRLLHETWKIKRNLTHKITTPAIDRIYNKAIKAGALGGKLLGAGGGGCILFFVEPKKQKNVKEKLNKLLHIPFRFENIGSQIIYYTAGE